MSKFDMFEPTLVDAGGGFGLRRLRRSDIRAVQEVVASAFDSAPLGESVAATLHDYCAEGSDVRNLSEQPKDSLPSEYWVLVQLGDRSRPEGTETTQAIMGLCGFYRFRWGWEKSLWLGWFGVSAARQGQDLGTRMLRTLMGIARGKGCEIFHVEALRDGRAVEFYKRLGWQEQGVIPQHYGPNSDAVVLSRGLTDIAPILAISAAACV